MTVTFACVLVSGHVDFSMEYVEKLAHGVRRWADRSHRVVCFTDQPRRVPSQVQAIKVATPFRMKGWWSKINLFRESNGLKGRIVYLDLDTLIVSSLSEIIDYPGDLCLVPDGSSASWNGNDGKTVIKKFNSSVIAFDAGKHSDIHSDFTRSVTRQYWGDQDWIAVKKPNAAIMPKEWFPRLSEIKDGNIPSEAKVILCKKPKNVDAAKQMPWFRDAWQ